MTNSSSQEIRLVPLGRLSIYERNCKQHPPGQISRIADSIAQYGFDQPIVVDKDYVIIKGHGRYYASLKLELAEVPVVVRDDLTEDDAKALRIADNKVAESGWDTGLLLEDISSLADVGISYKGLGFTKKQLQSLYPDTSIPGLDDDDESIIEQGAPENVTGDATVPEVESLVSPFRGDDAWMRRLHIVDFLNMHDHILVGFSGGKDSLSALIWCLEHCDRSKIVVYFSNLGWGVDWPHGIMFLRLLEKKYGIHINMIGPCDPKAPGRFEDGIIQHGYMNLFSCWLRNYVKVRGIVAWLNQEKYLPKYGGNNVQVVSVRWAESAVRKKMYPERGYFNDTKMHFASPIISWSLTDVVKYIDEQGLRLHTAYEHTDRMGCMVCPHDPPEVGVVTRKKFPRIFANILRYIGMGSRKYGKVPEYYLPKLLRSLDEFSDEDKRDGFIGPFSSLALTSSAFEDYYEQETGESLPRPYVTIPFDGRIHPNRSDLKPESWDRSIVTGDFSPCSLSG